MTDDWQYLFCHAGGSRYGKICEAWSITRSIWLFFRVRVRVQENVGGPLIRFPRPGPGRPSFSPRTCMYFSKPSLVFAWRGVVSEGGIREAGGSGSLFLLSRIKKLKGRSVRKVREEKGGRKINKRKNKGQGGNLGRLRHTLEGDKNPRPLFSFSREDTNHALCQRNRKTERVKMSWMPSKGRRN